MERGSPEVQIIDLIKRLTFLLGKKKKVFADSREQTWDNRTGKLMEQQQQTFTIFCLFTLLLILKQFKSGRNNQYMERLLHFHWFLSFSHENKNI